MVVFFIYIYKGNLWKQYFGNKYLYIKLEHHLVNDVQKSPIQLLNKNETAKLTLCEE